MAKVKKKRPLYVQGAWLNLDEKAFLIEEARRAGLRSATALTTKVMRQWIINQRLKRAKEIVQEASNEREKKEKNR